MLDRRKLQRTRVFAAAHIVLDNSSMIDCAVRTLSSDGAGIEIACNGELPNTFQLTFDAARTFRPCRVAWQAFNHVGVEFVQPARAQHLRTHAD